MAAAAVVAAAAAAAAATKLTPNAVAPHDAHARAQVPTQNQHPEDLSAGAHPVQLGVVDDGAQRDHSRLHQHVAGGAELRHEAHDTHQPRHGVVQVEVDGHGARGLVDPQVLAQRVHHRGGVGDVAGAQARDVTARAIVRGALAARPEARQPEQLRVAAAPDVARRVGGGAEGRGLAHAGLVLVLGVAGAVLRVEARAVRVDHAARLAAVGLDAHLAQLHGAQQARRRAEHVATLRRRVGRAVVPGHREQPAHHRAARPLEPLLRVLDREEVEGVRAAILDVHLPLVEQAASDGVVLHEHVVRGVQREHDVAEAHERHHVHRERLQHRAPLQLVQHAVGFAHRDAVGRERARRQRHALEAAVAILG